MRRVSWLLALVLALATPAPLVAQGPLRATIGSQVGDRPAFDYFLSRSRAEGQADEGVGGRLMWSLAPLAGERSVWLTRAYLGGYFVRSPQEADRLLRWRYGAQADFLLPAPTFTGRITPFVSLGLGATRERETLSVPPTIRSGGSAPAITSVRTKPSIGPGLGLRFQLTPGIGLRGDAREVLDIGDEVRRNLEFSGGLSIEV